MKTFYKTLVLGVFMAVVAVVSPTFAQDVCADFDANKALYDQYINQYKGTLDERKAAVKAGNEYVQKYTACADFAQQVDYLKKAVPKIEAAIKIEEDALVKNKIYTQFDESVRSIKGTTGNVSGVFDSGQKILASEPDFIDVSIVLATIGFDQAALATPNNTYNNETITLAKSVIDKVKQNKESASKKYGALGYEFNSKENTLGWMNYIIGYITYYHQGKKEEALPYLYKATQEGVETKNNAFIYGTMGDYYREKAVNLGEEIVKIIEANGKQENFDSKMKFALQKGYAERAIDAYARAYKIAQADVAKAPETEKPAKQKYVDGLKETLATFYKFRFETRENPLPENMDATLNTYVAAVTSKPMPNPTTEVQPVDPPTEEEKTADATATTPATSTTTTTGKTPATSTTTTGKTPAKPATNGATVKTDADKTNNKPKQR